MRIVSVEQMIALERQANQTGMSYESMMANAGKALAQVIQKKYGGHGRKKVMGLIGSGNNGGDTLIALTHLAQMGWPVRAYLVKPREKNERIFIDYIKAGGVSADACQDTGFKKLKSWLRDSNLIFDGMLGTGFKLPLKKDLKELLDFVKSVENNAAVIAVDCPSGVDCDSGQTDSSCLEADLTVCMAAVKQGLLKFPAFDYVGELITVDINLPDHLPGWQEVRGNVIDFKMAHELLPQRARNSHKGTYGSCMIIAGSKNYCGAVNLACEAAYRVGAGLVQAAVPVCIYDTIAGTIPEAVWLNLPSREGEIGENAHHTILENLDRISVILVGPGLGQEPHTKTFLMNFLEGISTLPSIKETSNEDQLDRKKFGSNPKMVIDADGLKLLGSLEEWHKKIPKGSVLTPHPGEMSLLTHKPIAQIQETRVETAVNFAKEYGHIIVLKGALTVIARWDGKYAIVPIATDALATAGTGDVLAGMITGLMAQGVTGYDAAISSAYLHAQAGLLAEQSLGSSYPVIAREIIKFLPEVLKKKTGN